MMLPYKIYATVLDTKLTHYLLSRTHPQGKSKANFFISIGYHEGNIQKLKRDLLSICNKNEVTYIDDSNPDIVIKYTITGEIKAPNGRKYMLKTIWAIDKGTRKPHLVTALPKRV